MPENPESLTKKDRVDALLRLGDSCWKQMDTRRAYEWKVSFGLWTVLAVIAGFLMRGELRPELWERVVYGFILAAIVSIYIFSWSRALQVRNAHNRQSANHFWGLAASEIGLEKQSIDHFRVTPRPALVADWSHRTQILFTVLLAVIAGIALFGKKVADKRGNDDKEIWCCKVCAPAVLPPDTPKASKSQ